MFHSSRDFVANGTFIDVTLVAGSDIQEKRKGAGIDALRNISTPEAMHDSSARDPPKCFSGTREEHIRNITSWGLGEWRQCRARVLWLQGPAGVGKSALAQTCAEVMGDRLGAAFFFSRPNQWNEPMKFFPTIIYQLAVKYPVYCDLVDAKILRDPLMLEKSMEVQFRELLVAPLQELSSRGHGIGQDNVIIVDGLDECDGQDAQRHIIDIITTSVRRRDTPFLWAFFSRPEPHIMAAFSLELAREVCLQLTLPVSRDADRDIEAYLRDGFRMIRAKYNFPAAVAWPSEADIHRLVDQSAGLFNYPASVVRYIAQGPGGFGPDAKLRSVLELGKACNSRFLDKSPLSNLDRFYLLIMEQIPKDILPYTLLLLFAHTRGGLLGCFSILGFSLPTFYAAISNLHSVLEVVKTPDGFPDELSFYHASFLDFLCDVERSTTEFCIDRADNHNWFYSKCVHVLYRLSDFDVNEPANIPAWLMPEATNRHIYITTLRLLFSLSRALSIRPFLYLRTDILEQLSRINWTPACGCLVQFEDVDAFFDKIPISWRPRIIQSFHRSPDDTRHLNFTRRCELAWKPDQYYVIGSGRNKIFAARGEFDECYDLFSTL